MSSRIVETGDRLAERVRVEGGQERDALRVERLSGDEKGVTCVAAVAAAWLVRGRRLPT